MISPNMQKKKQTVARVFLGSVRQESREQWLELCRQAISAIDNAAQLHQDYVYEGGSFDVFLKSLRPDNVAVLPYLAALSERPAEGGRVGYAFASRLRRIEARCMYVLDAEKNPILRSCDSGAWDDHVDSVYGKVTKGRKLERNKATKMAANKKALHPGVVADLKSRARAKERKRICVIWTSREYANVNEAVTAIGEEFPELAGASGPTLERITGVGRTGKPTKRT